MLPEHYKKRCLEFMSKEPTSVHYIPSTGTFGIHKNTKLPYVQWDDIRKYIFLFHKGGGVPLLLVFVFVYYILFATAQFNNLVPVVLI